MSNARIIELDGEAAGIVVGDENGFTFFAATPAFYPLERASFRSSRAAEKAITQFAREQKRRAVQRGQRPASAAQYCR